MSITALSGGGALSTANLPGTARTTVTPEPEPQETDSSNQALDREAEKLAAEEEAERLEHEARMQVIRDYIETAGAPEEKEQDAAEQTFWEKLQEQDEKRRQGLPGLANRTWGMTIHDPDDQGKVHVYTVKTNAKGEAKITRHVQFDSGDGEDRAQLTRERAKAAKAYTQHSTASRTEENEQRTSEKG